MWIGILLIVITALTRLVPHLPNFAPLVAISLFSGVYLKKKWSFLLPLGLYILTDLILGLHNTVLFTWGSIILIFFLGRILSGSKTPVSTAAYTLLSSFIFFLISNFGVWLMGWYTRTGQGLITCFNMAIPFFRTSLISDLVYVFVLFTIYELALSRGTACASQPAA